MFQEKAYAIIEYMSTFSKRSASKGFTLVEVLIVIIVLGIIATIVALQFNGVSKKAYDSVILSELKRFGVKIELYAAKNGGYPKANGIRYTPTSWPQSSDSTRFDKFQYTASKHAYETNLNRNLFYCEGTIGGKKAFRVIAKSKSGKVLHYGSIEGHVDQGEGVTIDDQDTVCSGFDYPITWAYGYYGPWDTWWSWIQ